MIQIEKANRPPVYNAARNTIVRCMKVQTHEAHCTSLVALTA